MNELSKFFSTLPLETDVQGNLRDSMIEQCNIVASAMFTSMLEDFMCGGLSVTEGDTSDYLTIKVGDQMINMELDVVKGVMSSAEKLFQNFFMWGVQSGELVQYVLNNPKYHEKHDVIPKLFEQLKEDFDLL